VSSFPVVPIKSSITTQLLFVVFSLYVIFAISVTLTHMVAEFYNTKNDVQEDLITFQETFEQGLATQVYNFDDQSVKSILRGMIKIPVIVGVKVRNLVDDETRIGLVVDAEGAVISTAEDGSRKLEKKPLFFSNLISHEFTLFHVDEAGDKYEAGKCVIYSSERIVFQKVQYGFIFILANAVLKTIALWLIFLYMGRRLLSRPLSELTVGIERVDLDQMRGQKIVINTKGRNELKILEEAFNFMLQKLYFSRNKLDEYAQGLEKSHDSLESKVEERTGELITAKLQLIESEKMAALGQLVVGISREIKIPVDVCVTSASRLQKLTEQLENSHRKGKMTRDELDFYLSESTEITKLIVNNTLRTATLVDIVTNQAGEQKQIFSLKPCIDDICMGLSSRLKKNNHHVVVSCDKNMEIKGYPIAFSLVMSNLVMSSILHGFKDREGGRIHIEVKEEMGNLVVKYQDDGIGIEKVKINKIFEPSVTTNKGASTSLGMHIVYNIVTQQLGGNIICESNLYDGVCFTITVPRALSMD